MPICTFTLYTYIYIYIRGGSDRFIRVIRATELGGVARCRYVGGRIADECPDSTALDIQGYSGYSCIHIYIYIYIYIRNAGWKG